MKAVQMLMMSKKAVLPADYGYLYNWYTASDANLLPTDWKVPTLTDWNALISSVTDGGDLKDTGFDFWDSPNTGADNSSGFTAVGNGIRGTTGVFSGINENGYIWAWNDDTNNNMLELFYNSSVVSTDKYSEKYGASIRAQYFGAGTPSSVTDNDGNIINVALMPDGKYWTTENWRSTTLNNGDPIPLVTSNAAWAALTDIGRCVYDNKILS